MCTERRRDSSDPAEEERNQMWTATRRPILVGAEFDYAIRLGCQIRDGGSWTINEARQVLIVRVVLLSRQSLY